MSSSKELPIDSACADWNCKPPNPGASYESKSRRAAAGSPGRRRVLTVPRRACRDAAGSRKGPYSTCTPIQDNRVSRQTSSGPVVASHVLIETRQNQTGPDEARRMTRLIPIGVRLGGRARQDSKGPGCALTAPEGTQRNPSTHNP